MCKCTAQSVYRHVALQIYSLRSIFSRQLRRRGLIMAWPHPRNLPCHVLKECRSLAEESRADLIQCQGP